MNSKMFLHSFRWQQPLVNFSKTVETTIDITPLADINSNNLALFAVIYEHATYNNVGTNGETEFINVVKKMMPSSQGQSLGALSQGAM